MIVTFLFIVVGWLLFRVSTLEEQIEALQEYLIKKGKDK